jgi:GH43 family beta-xylosidase
VLRSLAPLAALVLLAAPAGPAFAEPPRYQNPIVRQRADPWVQRHTDGWYYFTASVPQYDRIEIRRSRTIQGLGEAEPTVIWRRHDNGIMSANIWAPEIHFIDGSWYIYFAAARTSARFDHRIYVLQNDSQDPLAGTWVERGRLDTGWSTFSLDATTFAHRGRRYLVWAQRDFKIPGNSNLYIAPMADPLSLAGPAVRLSVPEHEWETQGFLVNEGPAVLVHGGRVVPHLLRQRHGCPLLHGHADRR